MYHISQLLKTIVLIYTVISDLRYSLFVNDMKNAMEDKRDYERRHLLGSLRKNICVVVEKNCCYKVFNKLLRKESVKYIYVNNDSSIEIKKDYTYPDRMHYLFSPYLDRKEGFQCYYCNYTFYASINDQFIKIFQKIFKNLYDSGYTEFYLEEVAYKIHGFKKFRIYEFCIEEIGNTIFTEYFDKCDILEKLKMRLRKLKRARKSDVSKANWSTMAVDSILELLVEENILRGSVDLQEYPDIIKVITPFPLLEIESYYWVSSNIVNFGFDLRDIRGSELRKLFNMDVVDRLCIDEGIYIVTDVY